MPQGHPCNGVDDDLYCVTDFVVLRVKILTNAKFLMNELQVNGCRSNGACKDFVLETTRILMVQSGLVCSICPALVLSIIVASFETLLVQTGLDWFNFKI
ncbi:26688_t:CDS:2 [Gigaspora margarita]|uniref:26688_t:CDS:1 n=1 Tax=Gigaspora margarita TaxID=4874 RepID=A0ABN7UKV1_GIGMA|nr:26688_t:CDS:2 [Gigaspora margarita]